MPMRKPKLYIVTGISGSGKTTVARHLIQAGEVAFDSKLNSNLYQFVDGAGQAAKSVDIHNEAWRKQYKWSLNEARLGELLEQNQAASRVFLCGRANIFQYWDKAQAVFLLKVNALTLHQRLNNASRDNLFAKDAETQNKLLNELDLVQAKIAQKGAIIIDANISIEEVVNQIIFRLKSNPHIERRGTLT